MSFVRWSKSRSEYLQPYASRHYSSTARDCPERTQPKEGTPCGVELFLKHELNTLYLFKFRAISFHISWLERISEIKPEASQTFSGGPCLVGILLELLLMFLPSLEICLILNRKGTCRSTRFAYRLGQVSSHDTHPI